jgi:ADP-dependent NAD(P)H-hydrate dehydratase / NAD(P)H-hydrate epimerase
MIPVVTPERMREIDAAAPVSEQVLIERAGGAVARSAIDLLGGTYGRRVVVLCGPGNNGADGAVAAHRLERKGVRVDVRMASDRRPIERADLVIDAVLGTGVNRPWTPPSVGAIPVLAVDIPSGVDGLTGVVLGTALAATRTVTFAALKPGLLFADGARLAGELEVADIGLDVGDSDVGVVDDGDAAGWLPRRDREAHKWQSATWVIGGSLGMTGAPWLAARGAQRAGAGMVRCSVPGDEFAEVPREAVGAALGADNWAATVIADLDRRNLASVVVGPGLGRADSTAHQVRALLASAGIPAVVDADALFALAWGADGASGVLLSRPAATVLTPHDAEFALFTGQRPGADRITAARDTAFSLNSTVLLKGPTTVIAAPDGSVRLVMSGDERLASAGTGDVLAGMIGALLAQGCSGPDAASLGAWLHGRAAARCEPVGFVAGDLCDALPPVLSELRLARG